MKTIVTLKSFPDHKGIPGHQGGSLPRDEYAPVPGHTKNRFYTASVPGKKFVSRSSLSGNVSEMGDYYRVFDTKLTGQEADDFRHWFHAPNLYPDSLPTTSANSVAKLTGEVSKYSQVKASGFGKGYMFTGDDRMVDISGEFGSGTNDHPGYLAASDNPEAFGLTSKDAKKLLQSYEDMDSDSIKYWDKMFKAGVVRVREFGNEVDIETYKIDNPTLRRLQHLVDEGKIGLKKEIIWSDLMSYSMTGVVSVEDFMSAKYAKLDKEGNLVLKERQPLVIVLGRANER